jgi:2-polyprenyl-3-methyl-5-hydroxy-6-metoxy-1,4-benzoquinol methylase
MILEHRKAMKEDNATEQLSNVYNDDYLFFSAETLGPDRTQNELAFIWQVLGLQEGAQVLDLGCGHGRIANGLAARGANVTGIDVVPLLLDRAQADAAKAGLKVDYRNADIRQPISGEPLDAALLWFFSFGYHSDQDNYEILKVVSRALKPGGKLLFDQYNTSALARAADHYSLLDFGNSFLIQKPIWNLEAGRWGAERIVVRDGDIRRSQFMCRCYSPVELSAILDKAGFCDIQCFGDGFKALELDSTRLIILATKKTGTAAKLD